MKDWPPSNYPIFLALVLLATTAVTLAMGDEPRAESLAIYAYYMLVIGVTIRFFELALPDNALHNLGLAKMRISGWLKLHTPEITGLDPKITRVLRIPHIRILYVDRVKLEKILVPMSDVSRDVAICLSVFFAASIIYGLMIDWWAVKGYISNLVLIIFGLLTLHFFTKASASGRRGE